MYSGSSHAKNQVKSLKSMKKATNQTFASNNDDNLIKTHDIVESDIEKTFLKLKKSVDKMQIQDYKLSSNQYDQKSAKGVSVDENLNSYKNNTFSAANNGTGYAENRRTINRSFDGRSQQNVAVSGINNNYTSLNNNNYSSSKVQKMNLNRSVIRTSENDNEIHIYLPETSEKIEQNTKIIDSNSIIMALNRLRSNYDSLREKLSRKKKIKETEGDDSDIFVLQNNMNEMNKLIEQLEEKKILVKEKNIMIILEKERKKFAKEKEKLIQTSEDTIARLKSELEKSNSSRKELEIKVKMLEPIKFELEKKVRMLDQEKKAIEIEFIKIQNEMATFKADVEKYRVLYNMKEKEIKVLLDKFENLVKQKEALEDENRKMLPKIGKLEAENIFLKNDNERIISETNLKINELRRDINDLNVRIKSLTLEINDYKAENEDLKNELKEERIQKERILVDKMNIESRLKEYDLEVVSLKRKIDELLRRPPQIIKETLPPIETIIEKPVEKTVLVDNPDNIRDIEFLKNRCLGFEREIVGLTEQINSFQVEIHDREMEITHWKTQFQQLERRKFDEIEISCNERIRIFEQENEDLKYRLRFLSEELKRQCDLNQEKNQNLGSQIRGLTEKNQHLEQMLDYYKYNR